MKKFNVKRYILLLGSASSTILLLISIGYISGVFEGDAMRTESIIDSLVLLSQRILTTTVFAAIASDIISFNIKKKPNED